MVRLLAAIARFVGVEVPDDHAPMSVRLSSLAEELAPPRPTGEDRRAQILAFAAQHGGEVS